MSGSEGEPDVTCHQCSDTIQSLEVMWSHLVSCNRLQPLCIALQVVRVADTLHLFKCGLCPQVTDDASKMCGHFMRDHCMSETQHSDVYRPLEVPNRAKAPQPNKRKRKSQTHNDNVQHNIPATIAVAEDLRITESIPSEGQNKRMRSPCESSSSDECISQITNVHSLSTNTSIGSGGDSLISSSKPMPSELYKRWRRTGRVTTVDPPRASPFIPLPLPVSHPPPVSQGDCSCDSRDAERSTDSRCSACTTNKDSRESSQPRLSLPQTDEPKKFLYCQDCNTGFKDDRLLQRHREIICCSSAPAPHPHMTHKCGACSASFKYDYLLKRHQSICPGTTPASGQYNVCATTVRPLASSSISGLVLIGAAEGFSKATVGTGDT
jgi:hypothetical protein